jgi:hypothetical protein
MQASDQSDARSQRRRLPIFSAGLVLALGSAGMAAAQARAASISVPAACVIDASVVHGSPMIVDGSGFTPGDSIELTTNRGTGFGTATADATGSFQVVMTAPVFSRTGPAVATFELTATDQTDGVTTATTSLEAANLGVATTPQQAKAGAKVTYTFAGFMSGAEIYGHYLHRNKVTATARFGRGRGPCGVLKTRARLYPGRQRYDTYTVQFDNSRRYSPKSRPYYVTSLNVFKF